MTSSRGAILFFDDYPLESENQLFLILLRRALRGLAYDVVEEKTIPRVEIVMRSRPISIAILDVMAAVPNDPGLDAVAGIEVLRRLRQGEYGALNSKIPVFMRTARGELHIRRMALHYGCSGYYSAGSEDRKLIQTIIEALS